MWAWCSSSKGAWQTGEQDAFAAFGERVRWHNHGGGFTWDTQDLARDTAAAPRAFGKAQELMADPDIRLLVLDELNIALRYAYLDLHEVVQTLKGRRQDLHIVVTGRNAKPELLKRPIW